MKRALSTSFVLFVLSVIVTAVWMRFNAMGSYRVKTEAFAPEILQGDFLLVPYRSFLRVMPFSFPAVEVGDFIVVSKGEERSLSKVVGVENGKTWVISQKGEVLVDDREIVGRVWKIWFSVSRPGRPNSKVRWERVLQGIK